jgi:hypothetical protein
VSYAVFSLVFVAVVDHKSFHPILLYWLNSFVFTVSSARIYLLSYYQDVDL